MQVKSRVIVQGLSILDKEYQQALPITDTQAFKVDIKPNYIYYRLSIG